MLRLKAASSVLQLTLHQTEACGAHFQICVLLPHLKLVAQHFAPALCPAEA